MAQKFTLTEQHVKLLRNANCCRGDIHGAPGLDVKRPFGNSDTEKDMHELLFGAPAFYDLPEEARGILWERVYKPMFEELYTALAVVLTAGSFEPGVYVAEDYGNDWKKEGKGGGR